jgi:hypothetical protein
MFELENSEAGEAAGGRGGKSEANIWLRIAAIAGLTTISVLFVMTCPCDSPWQTPGALALLLVSLAACLGAAFVLFHTRQFLRDSAPILRGAAAVGIAIAVRLVELKLAINCVAWLAAHPK